MTDKPKDLDVLVGMGSNKGNAKTSLKKLLPFPEGHEAYGVFTISTEALADGRYLARADFQIKDGFETVYKRTKEATTRGTGAYQSGLEIAAAQREDRI